MSAFRLTARVANRVSSAVSLLSRRRTEKQKPRLARNRNGPFSRMYADCMASKLDPNVEEDWDMCDGVVQNDGEYSAQPGGRVLENRRPFPRSEEDWVDVDVNEVDECDPAVLNGARRLRSRRVLRKQRPFYEIERRWSYIDREDAASFYEDVDETGWDRFSAEYESDGDGESVFSISSGVSTSSSDSCQSQTVSDRRIRFLIDGEMVDFGGDERGSDESVASDNDVVLGFDDDEREVSMIRESEVETEKLENDIIKDEEGPKKEQCTMRIDEDDFDPEAILAPCNFPQWFLDWFDQKKLAKWVIKGDAKRTESMRI